MTKMKYVGVALLALLVCGLPAFAGDTTLQHATAFGAGHVTEVLPTPAYGLHLANPVRQTPKVPATVGGQRPSQYAPYAPEFSSNGINIQGVGNGFPGYSVPDAPPDTTMAVGDTEIVQGVNVSYADFNKSTGAIIPVNGLQSTLFYAPWHALIPNTLCGQNNDGDIIVKWDRDAHRWILLQNVFVGNYATCIAVSQTATFSNNSWYVYQYPVMGNGFPDYPKVGIWSSGGPSDMVGYTHNDFGPGGGGYVGAVACGFNRAKLIAGDASAEQICHLYGITPNYQDSLLAADRDSVTRPPATEDEFFIGSLGDDPVNPNSRLGIYSMHVNNWSTGDATFTGDNLSQELTITTFTPACGGNYGGACIPQMGTTDLLDSLGGRLMYRFSYWEDQPPFNATATPPLPAPRQHWGINWDCDGPNGIVGVCWAELQASLHTVPVTSLAVFQQGLYQGSPTDSIYRWMGSIARDKTKDILLGYSWSSSTQFPGIYVAGRKFTDTLGTLSAEVLQTHGTGSQPDTSNRWGDYSTMSVDPTDNCTFWYTTEYYMTTATFDWSTNVSGWKFPTCH